MKHTTAQSKNIRKFRSILAATSLVVTFSFITHNELSVIYFKKPVPVIKKAYANVIQVDGPKYKDPRVQNLYEFLLEKDSPLYKYVELIVAESDKNAIDYTLLTAISGKESSFGKAIKEGSYNAWGVMAWTKEGVRHIRSFSSWEDGIRFEAKLLGDFYRINMIAGIQEKYCPSYECSSTWTSDVLSFSEEMKGGE